MAMFGDVLWPLRGLVAANIAGLRPELRVLHDELRQRLLVQIMADLQVTDPGSEAPPREYELSLKATAILFELKEEQRRLTELAIRELQSGNSSILA